MQNSERSFIYISKKLCLGQHVAGQTGAWTNGMGHGNTINKQLALFTPRDGEGTISHSVLEPVLHKYSDHHSYCAPQSLSILPDSTFCPNKTLNNNLCGHFIHKSSIYKNNLWVCGMSSDISGQIFGTISERMDLDSVLYIPIWNQDMRIPFALDSSCYTLLAVLLFTV